jgi:hypothetical protein
MSDSNEMWIQIEKYFIRNIETKFKQERVTYNFTFKQGINLFYNFLTIKTGTEIDGIGENILVAIQDALFDKSQDRQTNNFCLLETKLEPFLGKVLFFVDNKKYNEIKSDSSISSRLLPFLNALYLNPKNTYFDESKIKQFEGRGDFTEYLCSAYVYRNIEAHKSEALKWPDDLLRKRTIAILVTYLFAIFQHYRKLKLCVEPNNLNDYLLKQSQLFKIWQSRFVHIEGREEFTEIALYAKEVFESEFEEDDDETDCTEEKQSPREGKIEDLRKSISVKQMIVLGEVGMGKSTTLQYLHFKDSVTALQNSMAETPIYFELKNLTEKDDLLEKIIAKIGVDRDFIIEMLKNGKFSICLDGLNEIEKSIKTKVFTQIKNLISDFPGNYFLITSRPQAYNREFDDLIQERKIPVFILQKMDENQIFEFLEKNGKNVKEQIKNEILINDRLKKIVQTPLMLMMLIAVVREEGKIPNEKGKIIRAFMSSLYNWEKKQNIDFDVDSFHLLLSYLGYQTRNLTGSNSGLDRDEYILPIIEERKSNLGLSINLLEFLRKGCDINILVNDNNQYSFSHELYQEYFAAEYLHQINNSHKND